MNLSLVSIHIEKSSKAVSLGCAMLAAGLKQRFPERVRVNLLDLYLQESAGDCVDRILQQQPDWVGLSLALWNRKPALEIADRLKTLRPDLVILAGGPEATADPLKLAQHPSIDLVLPGEGERLIVETLDSFFQGSSIAGIRQAMRPAPAANLALLPSPWLDGTLRAEDHAGLVWELSRGCPFKCDFCFESLGTEGIRRFPPERLRAELELFAASGVNQVFVLDPTFNFHRDEAKRMLRLMAEAAPDIHFNLEIRSEYLDGEMAALFAGLNCSLQIGLQSADPKVLANLNRGFDPLDFQQKVMLLHEAGVAYGFDLIYGLPGDTLDGFLASLDFALAMAPNHLDIFPLSVLPGTRLAETAPEFGLVYAHEPPYRIISSPTFGEAALATAARVAEACTLFYNKGAAVPWFGLLLENLEESPAEFFVRLSVWLKEWDGDRKNIPRLQQAFLSRSFAEREQPDSGRIAADIAAWFGRQATLTDPTRPCRYEEPGPGYTYLNPLSAFAGFRTDPGELLANLERGISDFEELAFFLEEQPCEVLIYLHEGEVDFLTLTAEQSRFLKNLPLKPEDAPPTGELAEFLAEVRARGIVRSGS
jgi:radical SAM superfamily enzyme YgiQ (UPF0313 family)